MKDQAVTERSNAMASLKPTLHLLCGKIASGKSTLAAQLVDGPMSILICEDDWLSSLYPGEIKTLQDFKKRSRQLESVMGPHVGALLSSGLSVVLDFHANTRTRRAWMRAILDMSGANHKLHLIDVPDEVCKARLRTRNKRGEHAYETSDKEFDLFATYFDPPALDEGIDISVHRFDANE